MTQKNVFLLKFLTMAFLTCSIVFMGSEKAFAGNHYGALTYSSSTGAHGYAIDYRSRKAAERRALRGCRKHGGGCRVTTWFKNSCGALAVGNGGGWGASWGTTVKSAKRKALRLCKKRVRGCYIKRWACTTRPR